MPPIEHYGCTKCEFALPIGWGGYTYAVDDNGQRHVCPHPLEFGTISQVTGLSYSDAQTAGRVGYMSHCVCIQCLTQLDLDTDRDPMLCDKCGSDHVQTAIHLIGNPCPLCQVGSIEKSSPVRWKLDPDWQSLPVPQIVKDWVLFDKTRDVPPSLTAAFDAAERYDEGNFYTVTCRILGWWEGNYFASTEAEMDQQDAEEMNPRWTWCKALAEILASSPSLADLIVIRRGSCTFNPSVTAEVRRGIKNYLRKHREHIVWS